MTQAMLRTSREAAYYRSTVMLPRCSGRGGSVQLCGSEQLYESESNFQSRSRTRALIRSRLWFSCSLRAETIR